MIRAAFGVGRRLLLLAGLAFGAVVPAGAQDLKPIRIGFQSGEINVLLSYALGTSVFKDEGLEVTTSPFPAGPAMLPALAGDAVDIAWMGEFPAVTGYANGLPIAILFMERIDLTNVRLVANPKVGIEQLKDLKGKKIGVAIGSTSHYHTLRALKQAGLTASDVTMVNLSPANMPPAYVAGQIDAAFVWEPNVGAMEREGARPIATTKSVGLFTGGIWVARKPFLDGQGETVSRFLKAWSRAQQDYKADPPRVRSYEAKRIGMSPEQFDKLVDGQTVAHPSFQETMTADFLGAPGQELDSRLMKHLQAMGAFLLEQNRIQAAPKDWAGLFDTKPVQARLASASQ